MSKIPEPSAKVTAKDRAPALASIMGRLSARLAVAATGASAAVAIADTADRRLNPGLKQPFRILNGYILAAPVAVMDQAAAMQGPPVMQSLLQRIKHEPRMRRAADAPADDPAGKGINDEGDIDKASPGRDISKVRDPKPVRRQSLECPIDVILRTNFIIASSDKEIQKVIEQNKGSLQDAAISVLSTQSLDALDGANGREVVRKGIISKFNRLLGAEVIDQIYFTEFIVQ